MMPGRLKKPGFAGAAPVFGAAAGRAAVGAVGVVVRWIGAAVVGAVEVGGGADWVREPRLPALTFGRASASTVTIARALSNPRIARSGRQVWVIAKSSQGNRLRARVVSPHMGADHGFFSGRAPPGGARQNRAPFREDRQILAFS
jgi:hypothetical protein